MLCLQFVLRPVASAFKLRLSITLLMTACVLSGGLQLKLEAKESRSARCNEAIIFPTAEWQWAAPEEVGMDPVRVAEAVATLPEPAVVIYKGKIIAAKGDITRPGYIWSASKSLVALIAARLMQQGHICLDTPVPGSHEADDLLATYRHFLSMTSDYGPFPRSPGERYAYNNGAVVFYASHILATYFPGRDEVQMLRAAYLDTLGFEDGVGFTESLSGWGGGWSLSTRDLARIGYLVLRGGEWQGQPLLPASFINDLYVSQIPEHATEGPRGDPFYNEYPIGTPYLPGAYSYGFWLAHNAPIFGGVQSQTEAVSMWGAFGTTVMISRTADLVIAAVNASEQHAGGQLSSHSLDLLAQAIIYTTPPIIGIEQTK
jgi:CubicO group peptidase (beta-lactamase class C family)